MSDQDEQLLDKYRRTIQGALLDAYFSAVAEPWKEDCRKALLLSGFPESDFQQIVHRVEKYKSAQK
jgi:hypothetical protein